MSKELVIALDAMGGDNGPDVTIPGAELALVRRPNLSFRIFGDQERVSQVLDAHDAVAQRSQVFHAPTSIAMDEKPSQALRRGRRDSSMALAIQAVKTGDADIAISAGNTGALMAMSKTMLRTMPGIERPAIAAIWPTVTAEAIVLDMGANVGADARQLADFALMGAGMARALFGVERPSVALLNIGEEEAKGLDEVKRAHAWLREVDLPLDYRGFIEGDKIGHGFADVIVTEGFSGNIALKTAEGTAKQISAYLKSAMNRSWLSKLGGMLAYNAFQILKEKMDPRRMNGGVFLGLNGLVVKSHGGTDPLGFASAIELAHDIALSEVQERLARDVQAFHLAIDANGKTDAGKRSRGDSETAGTYVEKDERSAARNA